MPFDFDIYAARGKEFVRFVAEELDVTEDKAGRIIRAVFHALRNWLSHEESFHLLAQLPMSLKGAYVNEWKFDKDAGHISHLNDFLEEVRQEDGGLAEYDFGNVAKTRAAITAVFKALNYFVSSEEMDAIISLMPSGLKDFITESIKGEGTLL